MSYLLDTNICIAILNDRPQDVRVRIDDLLSAGETVFVSSITRFELQYGSAKSNQLRRNWDRLSVFFSRLGEIVFDGEDAEVRHGLRRRVVTDEVVQVSRSQFEGVPELKVGMQFTASSSEGHQVVTITNINNDTVTVDGNHPLAGKMLHFDVTIVDVRDASPDELSHGHVHGPGGHHH